MTEKSKNQLKNKTAIITGGGNGLGYTLAKGLSKEGANVVIADIDLPAAKKLEAEIRSAGGGALALKVDVADAKQVENLVTEALKNFGSIDILINNAAVNAKAGTLVDLRVEDWDWIMGVNLRGTFLCCRAVLPHMISRRQGKILNIVSLGWGLPGTALSAAYGASKAAQIHLTVSLAEEVAEYSISVNAVSPAGVDSPGLRAFMGDEAVDRMAKAGILDHGEHLVNAALFLCGPMGVAHSGQILHTGPKLGIPSIPLAQKMGFGGKT
jgi:NAD(P)-dependent dehydrogenase (short-subunit alcohol dehydrogenase family)